MAAFFKRPIAALMALLLSANLSVNLSTFKSKYRDIDPGQYKNIILFIGDGMGYNSLAYTEKEYNTKLEMLSRSSIHGYSKTRSSSDAVTDSAAGGTALACATRTTNRAIGVFPQDRYSFAFVAMNLCELAQSYGRMAGVVTTDTNNGATPACFSAHTDDRGNGEEISRQQVENSNLDLLWAAKSDYVSEEYANEFGWTYLDSLADFEALEEGERSFGQFEGEIWREQSGADSPTLSAMTEKAVDMLDDDPDGFFLMVEGAHIDKNSHSNNGEGMTAAAMEFNRAINWAYDYADAHGDTLIVITADHETGGIEQEANGDFRYTTGSHTATDVPILVYGCDKFINHGETIKNKEIARRLSLAMGAEIGEFPQAIKLY
ncbi:MAG: alkaline phosphatase [Clostridia bacterium]|nr:alkaline phosphatase [Clostridia bacterium]